MVGPVLVGALLLALVQPAHAACGVVATAFDGERAYPTVVDAVVSMRRAVLDESVRSDREFVGAVVEYDGAYRASVGHGCVNQDTVTFAVVVPPGARLAALWHTHGAPGGLRDLFSAEDVALVRSVQRDFYLITPRGQVRVLRVVDVARGATMVRDRIGTGVRNGAARGVAVVAPLREESIARVRSAAATPPRDTPIG